MHSRHSSQLRQPQNDLNSAEAELEDLNRQLSSFESLVDSYLGSLLDQLSELNTETAALDSQLRQIREERMFGREVMHYQDGAPRPTRQSNLSDPLPHGISQRSAIHARADGHSAAEQAIPDIKDLYRKLARRYHPDLARSEADRAASNEQMTEINRAYNAGDLKVLIQLAGMGLPYGVALPVTPLPGSKQSKQMSELEQAELKLTAVRQQITRMSNWPIVRLSLEYKLAQHQGRNLLREMATELQYKVGRKLAERDYLQAQIKTSTTGKV
jgi:hypothetical protein